MTWSRFKIERKDTLRFTLRVGHINHYLAASTELKLRILVQSKYEEFKNRKLKLVSQLVCSSFHRDNLLIELSACLCVVLVIAPKCGGGVLPGKASTKQVFS